MALVLSILALLATFYQAYIQRSHNEKSVKPLVQINLTDYNGLLYVHIQNNGLGPFIVERLVFTKGDEVYRDITECLSLDPRKYQHVPISAAVTKVVPQGTYLEVFSKQFGIEDDGMELNNTRCELSALQLKVEGKDIYDNKINIERELKWFAKRHNI
jgi:hypothetical protein